MSDAFWTELSVKDASGGRQFTRLLGLMETCFYWDGEFNGTADVTDHNTIMFTSPALRIDDPDADEARFRAIWIATKQHHPLLAAHVEECSGGDKLLFVVSEDRINTIVPGTFEYVAHADEDQTQAVIERGVNGIPRCLSRDLPAAITVLRRSETEYDLVVTVAHLIFDGISSFVLLNTLCDLLSRWPDSLESPSTDLATRLAMVPFCDSLHASPSTPTPRLRWKRAIGSVIMRRRFAALEGGQTIPDRRTPYTPHTPALSRVIRTWLDPVATAAAVVTCRAQGATLGQALAVVGQFAASRMLHRRVEVGLLSKAEWNRRRTTPTRTTGPLNLRPHLETSWKVVAGQTVLVTTVGTWYAKMPFMPDAGTSGRYSDTLSPARFWLRARGVRREVEAYQRHPLLLEMNRAMLPPRIARTRSAAMSLRRKSAGTAQIDGCFEVGDVGREPGVYLHSGSSIGNVDVYCPYFFPVKRDDGPVETRLRRLQSRMYLRCRPAELYLGAATIQERLQVFIYFDANVYTEEDVQEWLHEVKEAMMCYLCEQTKASRTLTRANL
ncbi:unnamed protein product [Peniophora sp. CBMAI 1063]|nr:unnamed protein product [Peniophora sp. CBMAI 1063]